MSFEMFYNDPSQPKRILVVEDARSHLDLMLEVLEPESAQYKLYAVTNGEAALDFLYQRHSYSNAPRPDLIICDLHLPRINGHEILAQIKKDPQLKFIPVIIFTSSNSPADIHSSYQLNANCHITKPMDVEEFMAVIKQIKTFWLDVVQLP